VALEAAGVAGVINVAEMDSKPSFIAAFSGPNGSFQRSEERRARDRGMLR
jgi:hypothetical protein